MVASNPKKTPINIDTKPSNKNCPNISKGVDHLKDEFAPQEFTTLNRMIDTASFVQPSPNMIEYSLGYSSYLSSDTAAITSDEQSNEHSKSDSKISN